MAEYVVEREKLGVDADLVASEVEWGNDAVTPLGSGGATA